MAKIRVETFTHSCPRPPDAVVFDLDGTLVDSGAVIAASYNAGLKATGHRPRRTHDILAILGRPLEDIYARLIPREHVAQACDAYRAEFARLFAAHVKPMPGAVDLLTQLREAGVKTAICTNRARHTAELLEQCGLAGLVDAVVQVPDGPYAPKPDPAMLYAVMDKLDGIPSETCYIGDSLADMQAGRAAQVWTIGIQTLELDPGALESAGAHVVTSDLTALPRVLGLVPEPVAVAVEAPAPEPEAAEAMPEEAAPLPDAVATITPATPALDAALAPEPDAPEPDTSATTPTPEPAPMTPTPMPSFADPPTTAAAPAVPPAPASPAEERPEPEPSVPPPPYTPPTSTPDPPPA